MKTLYLVRHAKTIQGSGNLQDFDRYLKPRGLKDAKLIAELMKADENIPQQIISSPAKRAKQTAEIFCDIFGYSKDNIIENDSIYFGGIGDLINIFQNLDNKIHSVMLIGHNPTLHEMVNYYISSTVNHFPTCCVAGIQFDEDYWIDLKIHLGKLSYYEKPKEHK